MTVSTLDSLESRTESRISYETYAARQPESPGDTVLHLRRLAHALRAQNEFGSDVKRKNEPDAQGFAEGREISDSACLEHPLHFVYLRGRVLSQRFWRCEHRRDTNHHHER